MRRAAKLDDNQRSIVQRLESHGAFVQSLASIGKGCPDLLVGYRGAWNIIEIKDGAKPKSAQALSPDEIEWICKVRNRLPVHVVRNEQEALKAIGAS
jgi:Holliday junction resolvase